MEPRQFSRGYEGPIYGMLDFEQLQWSPGNSAGDTPGQAGGRPVEFPASMEPRQFSRGYVRKCHRCGYRLRQASMEPRQFSRGYAA